MPLPSPTDDITRGLNQRPASISPKYFYDQHGSQLFEEITRLPEYYPTRTETALMQQHADGIARAVGPGRTLIELGAGNCQKARTLCRLVQPACFVGVDISADFLQAAVQGLRDDFPGLDARAVGGDMTRGVVLPADIPRKGRLVFYPGSSIGNFDPPHALELLAHMRELIDDDGGLLIGIDLPKDVQVLEAAYDDAAGVTAAFNRNVLTHVNRLIGSDFDVQQWQHRAFFNQDESRIEMHLEALADAEVRWPGGARRFDQGERIHTENSYKYPLPVFTDMLARAGFSQAQAWTDDRSWFAVLHARP
ncbi:dimethylhistidine N-methyltransferase [Acidovorax sp. Root275]|uniref:L-histidine N(alpha)-methyltransferase n=1 Tax=Acidovorax sp. Root275 TaxID=1736508 RepID=UPI00070D8E3A|nr:L-histidine N(alpha)-methyltransferase [Acidovorax sp. Root275]KRD55280.1 dimethylhistidine N-methyltransferase [Acidovorax sp. Root275]